MIKKTLLFVLLSFNLISAQNLDSLYSSFSRLFLSDLSDGKSEAQHEKCGFGIVNSVKLHLDEFSAERQSVLRKVLQRPAWLPLTMDSPKGLFKIHYTLDSAHYLIDVPGYDLTEFAIALDSSYSYEIDKLGYRVPPSDDGAGGDDKIDVYIYNLGSGLYGYTETDISVGNQQFTSFMHIDNNFPAGSYFTSGINAAKVTAAHELHHVIQMGAYIFSEADVFYHELTSTSMEEFVFDDVNDYYGYMDSYLNNTSESLALTNGYESAVWNIFLKEMVERDFTASGTGNGIIKRSWELMSDNRAMEAIALALMEFGYSFGEEYNRFGQWLLFTGRNANPAISFEEGRNYPDVRFSLTKEFSPPSVGADVFADPASINFIKFINSTLLEPDTVIAVLANSDVKGAVDSPSKSLKVRYTLFQNQSSGTPAKKYSASINSNHNEFVNETAVVNRLPIGSLAGGSASVFESPFPQPFRTGKHSVVILPISGPVVNEVQLSIYTASLDLVYSAYVKVSGGEQGFVRWNGRSNSGAILPTGVYIYAAKNENSETTGKIVILND